MASLCDLSLRSESSMVPLASTSMRRGATARDATAVADGFYDLYGAQYLPMVRLARGLVDISECAEEIVQDAFVKVFERWRRIDEPAAYLRVVVVNGCRSELRKRQVIRKGALRLRADAGSSENDNSWSEHPCENDHLVDALDKLSPKRRTALVLRFYGQMSEREISEAMGVRPGTVKSLVSRGLSDLREVVGQ